VLLLSSFFFLNELLFSGLLQLKSNFFTRTWPKYGDWALWILENPSELSFEFKRDMVESQEDNLVPRSLVASSTRDLGTRLSGRDIQTNKVPTEIFIFIFYFFVIDLAQKSWDFCNLGKSLSWQANRKIIKVTELVLSELSWEVLLTGYAVAMVTCYAATQRWYIAHQSHEIRAVTLSTHAQKLLLILNNLERRRNQTGTWIFWFRFFISSESVVLSDSRGSGTRLLKLAQPHMHREPSYVFRIWIKLE